MFVTYQCQPHGSQTRFTRTLEYRFAHPVGRLADRLVLHKRIERDSAKLLRNLSAVAEHRLFKN